MPNKANLEDEIFKAKQSGLTDKEIGDKYNVNLRFIEKVMTKRMGINVSTPNIKKKIKRLQPKSFYEEQSTVWSFKSRGAWATHNGNYRGNWSPYIPRNVISKYSNENDLVLDCFCGAGTTGVECKLLNRDFIGVDINPYAIELAKSNIDFPMVGKLSTDFKPPNIKLRVGDARSLPFIKDESIDLICTHPPYADIIQYTDNMKQDLSFYKIDDFMNEMAKVAKENYRILKDGQYCAVLIGDMRKKKHVIPMGFQLIDVYLNNGFALKELVIKRQHNCRTTGFWYTNSIKYNFLLLAHEYLAIFKKSSPDKKQQKKAREPSLVYKSIDIELESTTVWIFDKKNWYDKTIQNLSERYDSNNHMILNKMSDLDKLKKRRKSISIAILATPEQKDTETVCKKADEIIEKIKNDGFLAVLCEDKRMKDGTIYPSGIEVEKILRSQNELKIKEVVVISIENGEYEKNDNKDLEISHKYLLVYRVEKSKK